MQLSLILGGARSGKSAFAERLALQSGRRRLYLATCTPWPGDTDMAARIALHRARRTDDWQLAEAPLDLAPVLRGATADQVVLVDCATLWLTNHLLAGGDLAHASAGLMQDLADCAASVIVVSNELGLGIVPETPLGRRFRDAQGVLNQMLAAQADLVALVVAGLPLVVKGSRPAGAW